MSEKIYLNVLRGGVYLTFLTTFFVFDNLLFPYITSKQIPFNLLIEALFMVWIAFIVKFPAWRPFGAGKRKLTRDWLTLSVLAFFAILTASCFSGVDFNLSFWGDIERMLGVFHLLHFLALYLIIITVFKGWPEWRNLLMVSVAAATIQSFYTISQAANAKAAFGTLGNTSYVSGQMIFNIFFALILFFRQKSWALRIGYSISMILMLISMKNAGTRGAFVGLGISILLMLFLLAMYNQSKKIKFGSIGLAIFFVMGIGLIFANSQSDWVKSNQLFNRIAYIDLKSNTFQTRLISWRSGFKDLPNHWLLGTGYGNYAISFDKYFDPSFYNWSRGETYFDHAHNNVVDILSTTGILGVTAYLSIFAAIVYYLIRFFRRKEIGLMEFTLLLGLLAAYFIQNIVLFDSFITYLCLMILFGYIYKLSRPDGYKEQESAIVATGAGKTASGDITNKQFFALTAIFIVVVSIAYQYNIKVYKMLDLTIAGQAAAASGNLPAAVDAYKKAYEYDTVLDRDSRNTFVQLMLQRTDLLSKMPKEQALGYLQYAIELSEKNVAHNRQDSFNLMILAQILNLTSGFYSDNPQQFSYYSQRAEEAIDQCIAATPRRPTVYFIKAQIYLSRGNKDKAIEILKYAVEMNDKFPDSVCQLAKVYGYAGQAKLADEWLDKCVDSGGADTLYSGQQLSDLLNRYFKAKQYDRAVKVLTQLTALDPDNIKVWTGLAEAQRQLGNKEAAAAAANKAAQIDPSLKSSAEQFIQSLK
ncbi:tetratricopeptide repeat protein [Candidatus Falkowbacteria bacterium]|nr:tetratricopeptide repeat protein [Candidatus Falkowbacteria bacterium]